MFQIFFSKKTSKATFETIFSLRVDFTEVKVFFIDFKCLNSIHHLQSARDAVSIGAKNMT